MTDEDVDDPADVEDQENVEDDQPEIEGDEMADFSAVSEEIEEQAGAGADEDEEEDDLEDTEGHEDTATDSTPDSLSEMDTSPGDVYCQGLGLAAATAKENWGDGVEDIESAVDEYAQLARTTDADEFVNEYMEMHGGIEDVSPGQGIVIATVMFGMFVCVDDPQIAQGLSEKAQEVGA